MTAKKLADAVAGKLREMPSGFKHIKPVRIEEIPSIRKAGVLQELAEIKEFEQLAKFVKENGSSPYEAFDVADLDEIKKTNPKAAKMKTLMMGFLSNARKILKQYQIEDKFELRARRNKVYLVATEE